MEASINTKVEQMKSMVPVLLVVAMMLAGRFNLGRIGIEQFVNIPSFAILFAYVGFCFCILRGYMAPRGGVIDLFILFHTVVIVSIVWGDRTGYGKMVSLDTGVGIFVVLTAVWLLSRKTDVLMVALSIIAVIYALSGIVAGIGEGGRMSALTAGSGVFARTIGMGLLATCYLSIRHSRWWLILLPLFSLTIFMAGSRVMWMACTMGFTTFSLLALSKGWWTRKAVSTAWALILGGILAATFLYGNTVAERLWLVTVQERYTAGRMEMWADAVGIIRDHPWYGIGAGAFSEYSPPVPSIYGRYWDAPSLYPHNLFLDAGVTIGIGGIVLLSLALGWPLWLARKCRLTPLVAVVACLFLLQFMAQMGSGTFYDGRWMWLFLLLLVALKDDQVKELES